MNFTFSRIEDLVHAACGLASLAFSVGALLAAQSMPGGEAPLTGRERELLVRIERLEKRVAALEEPPAAPQPAVQTATPGSASAFPGTTLNFYFDGYYGRNFNRPVGRVNLLRTNDVLGSSFSLNQIGLILERTPDASAGRRFGGRIDLMFGQNTETLQGGAQNEPRPQVYRNIFQAYGTYVVLLGSGLTVDFGKFYSSLGIENNYAYDELNYSRSFFFGFLPFYHMGVRTTYSVNSRLTLQHWLVNGANQTEDFNGYKSNAFLLNVKPAKALSWNFNYYVGRDSRDIGPATGPIPDGRSHILDTYATWTPSKRLTVAGEFDHVVSRSVAGAPPSRVTGGAGYLHYGFTPKFSLAGRFEYLKDRGGLFSGATQDLKEHTLTATWQLADGFQVRLEHRRDFSNRPFFLTGSSGKLEKEQNTATMGLIWWFGGKRDSW